MNKGFTEAELLVASEHYRLQKDKAISKKNHKHVSQDQFYELMKDTHDKLPTSGIITSPSLMAL